MRNLSVLFVLCVPFASLQADDAAIRKAVTLYASFDEWPEADFGGGDTRLWTRSNDPKSKGKFIHAKGFDAEVFKINKKGLHNGCLEAKDVLENNGRIYFPMKDNIAFKKDGWSGAVSMWVNGDPNKLKTKFCDPIQITEKGAGNGGIWFDFNDAKPRDLRHGAFPAVEEGKKGIGEDDPNAPMVWVKRVAFKNNEWRHVVLSWKNFDTGKKDAVSQLWIDGKLIGEIKDREIAMKWDVKKGGIYVSISWLGMIDEMAIFNRALTEEEIKDLHKTPGLLEPLKKKKQSSVPSPKFPFDAETAKKYQKDFAKDSGQKLILKDILDMEFILIPPGTFRIGSPDSEPGRNSGGYDEKPTEVTLSKGFYLAKHEVTVGQFRAFVKETGYKTDGEKTGGGNAHDEKAVWKHRPGTNWLKPGYAGPYEMKEDHPVVHVSWTDAKAFCKWLKDTHKDLEMDFDLPTEAQWEWACRAGSDERFWWGKEEDTTGKRLNAGDKTLKKVHPEWPRVVFDMNDGHAFPAPVGSYEANAFGLHDMLGNVWEFCSTHYGLYPDKPVTDPGDLDPKRGHAVRGGGWSNVPADCRCATRNADPPHFCHSNLGFRVAIVAK
jgi:formylglycine-generating enzyme required for sulfatase activity